MTKAKPPATRDASFTPDPSTAEKGGHESYDLLRALVEGIPDAVFVKDVHGRYLMANSPGARLLGRSPDEVVGKDDSSLLPPEDARRITDVDRQVLASGQAITYEEVAVAHTGVRSFVTTKAPCRDSQNRTIGLLGIARDITDLKRTREELEQRNREIEILSQQLVDVEESERHNLARELHDEVGELVTSLSLVLEIAARDPGGWGPAKLDQAQELLAQLTARVRDISANRWSAILDDLGLLPALLSHCKHYTARTAIRVVLKQQGLEGRRFHRSVERGAYRIIQEALTNVARYASVPDVTVRVWMSDSFLNVQVEDAGAGFDPGGTSHDVPRLGLFGMRERARLLGGGLTVESQPGRGTCVTAHLPIEAA